MILNNQNIFQRYAAINEESNFSTLTKAPFKSPENDFTNAVNDNAGLTSKDSGNIFQRLSQKQKVKDDNQYGIFDTLKDVGQQVVSKGLAGIGGGYGNILDTLGLQVKEGQTIPGQEQRMAEQHSVLDKLGRGELPSLAELMTLSDDEPGFNRLPTSKELEKGIKNVTGIGEGKTPAGRIAGRGAGFLGEGVGTGGGGAKALLSLAGSGIAGQSLREAGAPEWAASTTEIGGSLLPSVISGRVAPRNARDATFVNNARNFGFNEREIAPLIQGNTKIATLKPLARKGSRTQQVFEDIQRGAGQIFDQIHQMPGAQNPISRATATRLETSLSGIRNNLSNTLQASPDKQAALTFIDGAINEIRNNPNISASTMMNFWSDINGAVNWNVIRGGKKQLARLKEPLADALNSVSPQIAQNFENVNELYSRYKNISNKLKPDLVDGLLNKGEIASAVPAGLALIYGNPQPLIGLAGEAATRILAREMLINPYFQNLANKLVINFNQSSIKGVTELVKQAQEYMNRKHPNEDWSFLTDTKTQD